MPRKCLDSNERKHLLKMMDENFDYLIELTRKMLLGVYVNIGRGTCKSVEKANKELTIVVDNLRFLADELERVQYLFNNPDRIPKGEK